MKIRFFLFLLLLIPCAARSQRVIETWEEKLKLMGWLIGEWEGVGFNSNYNRSSPMSFTYSADSLKIYIRPGAGEPLTVDVYDHDWFHVSMNGDVIEITTHLSADITADRTQLQIHQVGLKNMNVWYVRHRRSVTASDRVIFHGAFRKK